MHLLAPGGYFDSYFDPPALTQLDLITAHTHIPGFTQPGERRSLGPQIKWQLLDKLIDGAEFAAGLVYDVSPTLAMVFSWTEMEASPEQIKLVDNFVHSIHS